ncbi:MAG TPA: hypothetical protein GX506_05915, partial [Firmicutes bacterium]|nr:hypothetical protein [Bacillota bacterium]
WMGGRAGEGAPGFDFGSIFLLVIIMGILTVVVLARNHGYAYSFLQPVGVLFARIHLLQG